MSDPNFYYEAQSSGLGVRQSDLTPWSAFGEKWGKWPSLPVIIKFPKNWTAQRRYEWYSTPNKEGNIFFSIGAESNGDAQEEWQDQIDQAYLATGKWERYSWLTAGSRGMFKWAPKNPEQQIDPRDIPIFDALTNKIISEKAPLDVTLCADLGTTWSERTGGLEPINYLLPYSEARKANITQSGQFLKTPDGVAWETTDQHNMFPNIKETAPPKGIDFAVSSGVPSVDTSISTS